MTEPIKCQDKNGTELQIGDVVQFSLLANYGTIQSISNNLDQNLCIRIDFEGSSSATILCASREVTFVRRPVIMPVPAPPSDLTTA